MKNHHSFKCGLKFIPVILMTMFSYPISSAKAFETCVPPSIKNSNKAVPHKSFVKENPKVDEKIYLTNLNIISSPNSNCSLITSIEKKETYNNESDSKTSQLMIELFVKLISSLAWPVVVLIIAVNFKTQITQLLSRLRKGSIAGTEFYFDTVLEKYETPKEDSSKNEKSAAIDPRGTIISSWLNVETELANLLEKTQPVISTFDGGSQLRYNSPLNIIKKLTSMGLLTKDLVEKIQDLRKLRNMAAHAQDIDFSSDSVVKYSQLADEVVVKLKEFQSTHKG